MLMTMMTAVSAETSTEQNEANIEKATQIIESKPNGANYVFRANLYYENTQYEKAIIDCNEAIKLGYTGELVYEIRGKSYLGLDKPDEAVKDGEQVIELNPKNENGYRIKAGAYLLKDEYEQAKIACEKALELRPNDIEIKNLLEVINELKNATPEEVEKYRLSSGYEYFKNHQYELSIKMLNKVLETNPNNEIALKIRGAAHAELGEYELAIKDWEKLLELKPEDKATASLIEKAKAAIK